MTPGIAYQIQGSPTLAALQKEADRLQLLLNVTHILPWEASRSISTFTYVGEESRRDVRLSGGRLVSAGLLAGPPFIRMIAVRAIAKCHGSANAWITTNSSAG
jgi:hypothetical protein